MSVPAEFVRHPPPDQVISLLLLELGREWEHTRFDIGFHIDTFVTLRSPSCDWTSRLPAWTVDVASSMQTDRDTGLAACVLCRVDTSVAAEELEWRTCGRCGDTSSVRHGIASIARCDHQIRVGGL